MDILDQQINGKLRGRIYSRQFFGVFTSGFAHEFWWWPAWKGGSPYQWSVATQFLQLTCGHPRLTFSVLKVHSWRFPTSHGGTPSHPFVDGIFHCKPSSYWVITPIYGTPIELYSSYIYTICLRFLFWDPPKTLHPWPGHRRMEKNDQLLTRWSPQMIAKLKKVTWLTGFYECLIIWLVVWNICYFSIFWE